MAKIDFTDPNQVGQRKKKIALEQQKWQEALKSLMNTPEGVLVVKEILNKSKMFAPNLYAGSTNDTMYRLGQRDIGIWLFSELEQADSNLLSKIITEDKL
jgi:hypothetical protein